METLDFTLPTDKRMKFEKFHENNPEVFKTLERLAAQHISMGMRKIGINYLCEVVRWKKFVQTRDDNSLYNINNNYRPFYARKLVEKHPDWKPYFEFRSMSE